KLAAICSGTGICHRQLACFVEFIRRAFGLITEFIARTAHAGAAGIASLDHKVWNDSMKNCAAVKWAITAFAAYAIFPAALAFGQISEVLRSNGRFLFKKAANNLAFSRIKNRVRAWLACHELFLSVNSGCYLKYLDYFLGGVVVFVPLDFLAAGFDPAPTISMCVIF